MRARVEKVDVLGWNKSTTNQNKNNTSNTDYIHSCVTPRKQNYSVHATSTTTHLKSLNATLYLTSVKLHTKTKSTLTSKKYLCLLINKNIIYGYQVYQVTRTSNICQYKLVFFIVTKWFGFHSWYLFKHIFDIFMRIFYLTS